uniref:Uncharacterized protein n=1 Tax=Moniliophthora roreri TaxID=221103 RepID=A0A0W0F610_MONRR
MVRTFPRGVVLRSGEDDDEGGYLPTPQWEVYNSPDDEE